MAEEKFKMTAEEADKLEKALKNEDFRKMLFEYAEEISDPVNRARYEQEITELEKERGTDVTFIHPKPGFVLKAYVDKEKKEKIFINVCHSVEVKMASSTAVVRPDGSRGQNWSVPYSLLHPREDLDKAKKRCMVYDAVFNPGTLEMEKKDERFHKLIVDTVLEGIAREFKIQLKMSDVRVVKGVQYKGVPQQSVLRKPSGDASPDPRPDDEFSQKLESMYPYNDVKDSSKSSAANTQKHGKANSSTVSHNSDKTPSDTKQVTPQAADHDTEAKDLQYKIVQRGFFDIQDYRMARDSTPGCRPKQLIVTISLPSCESASGVDLDITTQDIAIAIEQLDVDMTIPLPYPVNEDDGSATFDRSRRELSITLNVLPPPPSSNEQRPATVVVDPSVESTGQVHPAACAGEENSDNESAVSGDSTVTQSPGSESPPADAQPADEVPGGMAGDHPQTPSPTTSHHSLPQVHSDRNGQNAQLVFRQADNLPDIQATEAESTVTVRLSSAGATNATTCTDNNVVFIDWDVPYYQIHYNMIIDSGLDEWQLAVVSVHCSDAHVTVRLEKRCTTSDQLLQTLNIGMSTENMQVITLEPEHSAQSEPSSEASSELHGPPLTFNGCDNNAKSAAVDQDSEERYLTMQDTTDIAAVPRQLLSVTKSDEACASETLEKDATAGQISDMAPQEIADASDADKLTVSPPGSAIDAPLANTGICQVDDTQSTECNTSKLHGSPGKKEEKVLALSNQLIFELDD